MQIESTQNKGTKKELFFFFTMATNQSAEHACKWLKMYPEDDDLRLDLDFSSDLRFSALFIVSFR